MKLWSKMLVGVMTLAGLWLSAGLAYAGKVAQTHEGQLIIEDNANLFTPAAKTKAKQIYAELRSEHERQVTIYTLSKLPAAEMKEFEVVKNKPEAEIHAFWSRYAHEVAKDDRARGIFILVCRSPGKVIIIASKPLVEAGFNAGHEKEVREKFMTAFLQAKDQAEETASNTRDAALTDVAQYLKSHVPTGSAVTASGKPAQQGRQGGSNIMQYVCIGFAILLGVWLIFGLIRAFSGGGGGGQGGGGGGGFMSGLMGGLFGAMAGMWLYNNLMGGHSYGDTGGAGDTGTSGGETGADDFSGDSGTSGGWDDGGSAGGGGDWGGGGGGDF